MEFSHPKRVFLVQKHWKMAKNWQLAEDDVYYKVNDFDPDHDDDYDLDYDGDPEIIRLDSLFGLRHLIKMSSSQHACHLIIIRCCQCVQGSTLPAGCRSLTWCHYTSHLPDTSWHWVKEAFKPFHWVQEAFKTCQN